MISELRVRQALASSIYFDPCFPLSLRPVSFSPIPSATFHLRGLLSALLPSQGSRVLRAKRHCGHWVVFHKVRSQVQAGLESSSRSDPETRTLIQVFHSDQGTAFLFLSWRVSLLTGKEKPAPGAWPRGRLSWCSRARSQKRR